MPKLAANLTMLYTEVPFLERFARAAADGFSAVEFLTPQGCSIPAIAECLDANGLSLVLFNMAIGDWAGGERGIAILPDRLADFAADLERAVADAVALGCPRLHCMAGIMPAGVDKAELRAAFVDNLKRATRAAGAADLRLSIEPINRRDIPGYFLTTTTDAVAIMDEVGADNLDLQYDLYHMQIVQGDLVPTFLALQDRIGHVQIADTPGRNEPGTGEINYRFVLQAIDEAGYDGSVGCEYRPRGETSAGLGWARPHLGQKP